MYAQKAFPTDPADYTVHLYNGGLRMVFRKSGKIRNCAPDGIHIVIQGLPAAHQVILMADIDLMERLPIPHQRAYDPVEPCDVILI